MARCVAKQQTNTHSSVFYRVTVAITAQRQTEGIKELRNCLEISGNCVISLFDQRSTFCRFSGMSRCTN